MNFSNWPQIITALAAVLSAVVGPVAAYFIARKQIRANLVSANRQKWIDAIRDDVSEFLTVWDKFSGLLTKRSKEGYFDNDKDINEFFESHYRMEFLFTRIKLRLNPGDRNHNTLLEMIEALMKSERSGSGLELPNRIVDWTQHILKAEWDRLKSLK